MKLNLDTFRPIRKSKARSKTIKQDKVSTTFNFTVFRELKEKFLKFSNSAEINDVEFNASKFFRCCARKLLDNPVEFLTYLGYDEKSKYQ